MRNRFVPVLVILFIITLIPACAAPSGRTCGKALTDEEMAVPCGRYQDGVDMWNRGRVRMPSPLREPILIREIEHPYRSEHTTVFVDCKGGAWYSTGDDPYHTDTIIRISAEGVQTLEHPMSRESEKGSAQAEPVIVLDGAVILIQVLNNIPSRTEADIGPSAYLECIDLEGVTRWRTEMVDVTGTVQRAWRLPEGQIGMATADSTFTTFSLKTGKLLESIAMPCRQESNGAGPLPIPDGGLIICGSVADEPPQLTRLAPDGEIIWSQEFPGCDDVSLPSLSEDGILLFGTGKSLHLIDCESGEILWSDDSGLMQRPAGVTYDGNFLAIGYDRPSGFPKLKLISPSGERIWAFELRGALMDNESDVIIFEDNSIMVAYRWGISLINPDGSIRWTIDPPDMGLGPAPDLMYWKLCPQPDGGLITYVSDHSAGHRNDQVVDRIFTFEAGG